MIRPVLTLGLLAIVVASGCSSVTPLANGQRSAEGVAVAVLDALARRDRAGLEALALSDREFRQHVWPELPASRPERNLPYSYVWGELHQKSRIQLAQTLAEKGGARLTLVGVQFAGETTKYPSYDVHREATFRVRDASGTESEIRLCGSMIEKDGVWKVFSFVIDD
jgi:uncharacterized protein YceK